MGKKGTKTCLDFTQIKDDNKNLEIITFKLCLLRLHCLWLDWFRGHLYDWKTIIWKAKKKLWEDIIRMLYSSRFSRETEPRDHLLVYYSNWLTDFGNQELPWSSQWKLKNQDSQWYNSVWAGRPENHVPKESIWEGIAREWVVPKTKQEVSNLLWLQPSCHVVSFLPYLAGFKSH